MAREKQLSLFEEGGLIDEGGTVDPVSGNDVPTGSLKEEVRDDIDAKLSEGEFVMPADVVRYHGLDKMMALRDEAKMGLAKMEAMGQMGNSDEATLPDDVPFGLEDLDIAEDAMEMQTGGFVAPTYSVPSQFQNYAQAPAASYVQQPVTQQSTVGGYMPTFAQTPPTVDPNYQTNFDTMMGGAGSPGATEVREYRNEAGQSLFIPFVNGRPVYPIPEGYTLYTPEDAGTAPPTDETTTPTTETTSVTNDDGPSGPSPEELARQEEQRQLAKDRKAVAKELGYTKEQGIAESLFGLTTIGSLVAGKPEAGTILQDGTIADGEGNSFDPITGKQVGFKGGIIGNIAGGLGLTKTEAEKFGLPEGSPIPEMSIAGLRSKAGDEQIAELLGISYEDYIAGNLDSTKVKSVVGETVVTTPTGDKSVTDVANEAVSKFDSNIVKEEMAKLEDNYKAAAFGVPEGVKNAMAEIQNVFDMGKLTPTQKEEFLNAMANQTAYETEVAGNQMAVYEPEDNDVAAGHYISAAKQMKQALETKAEERLAAAKKVEDLVKTAVATKDKDDTPTKAPTIELGGKTVEMGYGAGQVDFGLAKAAKEAEETKQKEKDRSNHFSFALGQSDEQAAKSAKNAVKADKEAQEQTGNPNAKAVTDRYGNAVRDGKGNVVTSGTSTQQKDDNDSGGGSSDKIVCTEMYRQTQLDDWKEAIKIWGLHTKTHLTPYHQKGYHFLFMPWVKGMRKSSSLTKSGGWLAQRRTQHLKYILSRDGYAGRLGIKENEKDDIVGRIWCTIWHPITYLVGRIRNG